MKKSLFLSLFLLGTLFTSHTLDAGCCKGKKKKKARIANKKTKKRIRKTEEKTKKEKAPRKKK